MKKKLPSKITEWFGLNTKKSVRLEPNPIKCTKKINQTFPLNKIKIKKTFVINHKTSDILEKTIFKLNIKEKPIYFYIENPIQYIYVHIFHIKVNYAYGTLTLKRKESTLLIFETGRMVCSIVMWNKVIYNPIESLFKHTWFRDHRWRLIFNHFTFFRWFKWIVREFTMS